MCHLLEVSESGYYMYLKNLGNPDRDAVLSAAIQSIIDESVFNGNYGVFRMKMILALRRQKVGMRKLRRIILKMGLIQERKRRPKGLTKATTGIQEKETRFGRTSPQISHIPSYLHIYLRSNASMGNCTFLRLSAALIERAYRSSCVIT